MIWHCVVSTLMYQWMIYVVRILMKDTFISGRRTRIDALRVALLSLIPIDVQRVALQYWSALRAVSSLLHYNVSSSNDSLPYYKYDMIRYPHDFIEYYSKFHVIMLVTSIACFYNTWSCWQIRVYCLLNRFVTVRLGGIWCQYGTKGESTSSIYINMSGYINIDIHILRYTILYISI